MSTPSQDQATGADAPADQPLWRPRPEAAAATRLVAFQAWAAEHHGAPAAPLAPAPDDATAAARYAALHAWSTADLARFWTAVTEYFDVRFGTAPQAVLADATMPGTRWFPGATLNYAEHALRFGADPAHAELPAILHLDETTAEPIALSWAELRRQVGSLAAELRSLGVRPGDRVGAYLPNIPQAIVALLATASIGAIWTSCAPDFGARSVLDRLQQIEPVVLFAVDGYHYGGKNHDRTGVVAELRRELPTVRALVHVPLLGSPAPEGALDWAELTAAAVEPVFEQLPFDHPLWVLYSSGTTGLPKAIVQSQGGILVEHLKQAALQLDLGPEDRFLWYTSTGWMMWNFLVAGLLVGATVVTYDGSPGHPTTGALWEVAARTRATVLGTSAAYVIASRKAELHPGRDLDLSAVRCIGTTGSPLPPTASAGSTTRSRRTSGSPRSAAAPTSAAASSAASPPCRSTWARSRPPAWARPSSPGTSTASRTPTRSASWSSPSRSPRCPPASGTTPTAPATGTVTSRCSPAPGGTVTGSPSPRAAP